MAKMSKRHFRKQLLVNIDAIIDALKSVSGVIDVDVKGPDQIEGRFEKKVFVTFAGCDEIVVLELY